MRPLWTLYPAPRLTDGSQRASAPSSRASAWRSCSFASAIWRLFAPASRRAVGRSIGLNSPVGGGGVGNVGAVGPVAGRSLSPGGWVFGSSYRTGVTEPRDGGGADARRFGGDFTGRPG